MRSTTYEFIIIGGGLSGCALAYYLACQKVKVLLLEGGSLCSGTSSACAGRAQIIEGAMQTYLPIVKAGYSRLIDLEYELETNLEWQTPYHLTLLDNEIQWQEYQKLITQLNLLGISAEMLNQIELSKAEPALLKFSGVGAALSLESHLNPFNLVFGYAQQARRLGVEILTQTPVSGFRNKSHKIDSVICGSEDFQAEHVVFATGAWSREILKMIGLEFPMYFTHAEAVITEPLPLLLRHHIGFSGFYDSVHGEQHAITLGVGQHVQGSLLISNALQPMREINRNSTIWGITSLMRSVSTYFPQLKNTRVLRSWSAPSPFLSDSLPAIGALPGFENAFIAAGFHLAISTIPYLADLLATSLIKNDLSDPQNVLAAFSPVRFFEDSRSGK